MRRSHKQKVAARRAARRRRWLESAKCIRESMLRDCESPLSWLLRWSKPTKPKDHRQFMDALTFNLAENVRTHMTKDRAHAMYMDSVISSLVAKGGPSITIPTGRGFVEQVSRGVTEALFGIPVFIKKTGCGDVVVKESGRPTMILLDDMGDGE